MPIDLISKCHHGPHRGGCERDVNQLVINTIKNIHNPLYQDLLLHSLLKINLELADQVATSVMY